MKKSFIVVSSLVMIMMAASIVSANQLLPEIDQIKPEFEVINPGSDDGGSQINLIDRNPTLYNRQAAGNHTLEGWTANGKVYTAVDGVVTKAYRVNADIEVINPSGDDGGSQTNVIDRNPTRYNKQSIGGHIVEGWTANGKVYTAVDGVVTKAYRVNADIEVINPSSDDGGSQANVIDRNPTRYNKQSIGGHIVEGWTANGKVYTAVDGVVVKN